MISSHQPIWALPVDEVYESLGSAPAGLLFAIGIIVALVPEGLLPTVTLSLAI
jgi:magnesium-transporting ATPase (P-type)